jgi:AraC-like DNA-binding protein
MTYNKRLLLLEINDHLRQNPRLRLQDIEQQLGIGRHTIERTIRTATGHSFREYRSQKQLTIATQLLSGPQLLQVKQVAFSLGYSSAKSFSRYFKARTGLSPSQFIVSLEEDQAAS